MPVVLTLRAQLGVRTPEDSTRVTAQNARMELRRTFVELLFDGENTVVDGDIARVRRNLELELPVIQDDDRRISDDVDGRVPGDGAKVHGDDRLALVLAPADDDLVLLPGRRF